VIRLPDQDKLIALLLNDHRAALVRSCLEFLIFRLRAATAARIGSRRGPYYAPCYACIPVAAGQPAGHEKSRSAPGKTCTMLAWSRAGFCIPGKLGTNNVAEGLRKA